MKRIYIIGLCLMAVFAAGAVSSASAALPEFLHCVNEKVKKFLYTESKCETHSATKEGEWEKLPVAAGSSIPFTSTAGESILEGASGKQIKCTGGTNKGEYTGPKTDLVTVTFTGCTAESGLAKCQNTSTKGEIVTNKLLSLLNYIEASTKHVGLALQPEASGGLFAEFTCEALGIKETVKVGEKSGSGSGNSVIGLISPINTWTNTFTLSLKCSSTKGTQEFTKFEGGSLDVLESKIGSKEWEKSCETSKDTITDTEDGEISA